MEEEFDEIEELATQFIQQTEAGLPVYMDSEEFQDVIAYFLDSIGNGHEDYARQALDKALALFPTDAFIRVLNANYYARQEDYERASQELDFAEFQLHPIPELYVARVSLARWKGTEIDAKALLIRALEMDPEYVDAHISLALEYIYESNIVEAVSHALSACKIDENGSVEDLVVAGVLDNEHHPQFELFFEAMTRRMPMTSGWWGALGKVCQRPGSFEKSVEAFKFLIALEEDIPDAYLELAEALFDMGDYEEAARNYDMAQQKASNINYNDRIGLCYLAMHDYESAFRYFSFCGNTEDGKIGPGYSSREMSMLVVDALAKSGGFEQARAFLSEQIKKNPSDIVFIVAFINLLAPQDNEDQIRALCQLVAESETIDDENKQYFLFSFVQYCYLNTASDLGVEICELFYDREIVDSIVNYYVAALYARKLMIEKACSFLETALQLYPQRVFRDFLLIDPQLETVPEIKDLIDIYAIPADEL